MIKSKLCMKMTVKQEVSVVISNLVPSLQKLCGPKRCICPAIR